MLPATGVDYTRTAHRLPWTALPAAVRRRFATVLGAPVESAAPAGGGFTNGFAAVLAGAGRSQFAKAAPSTDSQIFAAYVREAEVLSALPAGLPAGLSGRSMVDEFFGDRAVTDVFGQFALNGGPPAYLPRLTTAHLADLRELGSLGREALAGDSVLHNDLRADNIIIRVASSTPARALFCDWNFLSTGPAWADWVALLVYPRHAGIDVAPWLTKSPLSSAANPDHIDAWLAVLAAYMIGSGARPELATSPHLRTHQRFTARILIDWLSERRKWDL
ncbi:hypothetical protein [Arthrobacter sp. TMN-50]